MDGFQPQFREKPRRQEKEDEGCKMKIERDAQGRPISYKDNGKCKDIVKKIVEEADDEL
ncbi:MAG: hypothetical protein AABY22_34735 [Nanoarchaeota archaeon]